MVGCRKKAQVKYTVSLLLLLRALGRPGRKTGPKPPSQVKALQCVRAQYIAFAERSSGKQPFFCLALGHDCLYLIGSQLQPITAGEVEPGQI